MQRKFYMNKALSVRRVQRTIRPTVTSDGAGVKLKRVIGTVAIADMDPFLLLDHFGSDDPDDYIAGFPMHPHRGIETVTYMLDGRIRHRDSVGNSGVIERGGVQWMTAGSGILHEEMPEMSGGKLEGFQLWVNLPSNMKMTAPSYQEFKRDEIPYVDTGGGGVVKIVAGRFQGKEGAVTGIAGDPLYLDIRLTDSEIFETAINPGHSLFAYIYGGSLEAKGLRSGEIEAASLLVFEDIGEKIELVAGPEGARTLLVAGKPLDEPISRYGPFVMNTREEIETAVRELQEGTFIK